ncbi:MAG: hypothetical protein F4X39_10865 [Acidobacteriia bacterium]|nr:hypothetical protein [Terriglobia bacterium]
MNLETIGIIAAIIALGSLILHRARCRRDSVEQSVSEPTSGQLNEHEVNTTVGTTLQTTPRTETPNLTVERLAAVTLSENMGQVIHAANLINQKKIDRAIRLLESLDDDDLGTRTITAPDGSVTVFEDRKAVGMKHLHLAIAYRKKKIINRSDHHWRKAIEYDHPTGMAYEKLAISLSKQGRLDEAIAVCEALIRHPTIPEAGSYLTKKDMMLRRDKLRERRARGSKHA